MTADIEPVALRRLRDYASAWRAMGCGCGECGQCDARNLTPDDADAIADEIEALRAEVERRTAYVIIHRGAALACSDAVRAAYSDEHHRAERLAEALRGLVEYVQETAHHNAPAAAAARAALRDHDQEVVIHDP